MPAIPMSKGTETGIRVIGWPRFQQAMGGRHHQVQARN